MALVAFSLLVASVVYAIVRPPTWLAPVLLRWAPLEGKRRHAELDPAPGVRDDGKEAAPNGSARASSGGPSPQSSSHRRLRDAAAMAPPPPPPTVQPPADDADSPATPRASASRPSQPVPSLSLAAAEPLAPSGAPIPDPAAMPPPPLRPAAGRLPTLSQFPAANSAQRARGPAPARGPPSSSLAPGAGAGLAPLPSHASRPRRLSPKVTLEPGYSPLDWARISGPSADLCGLPPNTPYLRVPPSMLRRQTGRRGSDAWMAINGKVYNVTPYAKFHPGGVPELMRAAGRDGSRLFAEVHPWVNYETMLTACLVGLLIDEPEAGAPESNMDCMD